MLSSTPVGVFSYGCVSIEFVNVGRLSVGLVVNDTGRCLVQ